MKNAKKHFLPFTLSLNMKLIYISTSPEQFKSLHKFLN